VHFILVSIFLICLDDIGQEIEESFLIDEDLLDRYLAMGERLLETI
jgi:hypothetical protein